jgi:membrane protein DedA with SNARE-associated domain
MMNGAEYFTAGALGAFFGALVFYLMGKKAGKNEEKGNHLKGCVRKNKIVVDVEHADIDKLRYRD